MDDLIKFGGKALRARHRAMPSVLSENAIRAMRAAADPVDFITEQRRLDKLMGREVYEGPSFEGIDLPEDDISAMVATGAPRSMLERAQFEAPITAALRENELPPLLDMLREASRSRALTDSRLERMTPEQQASSLAFVGRQADQDPYFSSGYRQKRRQERRQKEAAIAGGLAMIGGAFAAKMAEEASDQGYEPPEMDLSGEIADLEPSYPDIGDEPVSMDIDFPSQKEELVNPFYMPMSAGDAAEFAPGPTEEPVMTKEQLRALMGLVDGGQGYDSAMKTVMGKRSR